MTSETTPVPKKARISDRTQQENHLILMDASIAREKRFAKKAEQAGNLKKSAEHLRLAESLIAYREVSVAKDAEFKAQAKSRREKPIPKNYVPEGVPVSQLTDHQKQILDIDKAIAKAKERADRFGVEGEHCEDVDIMHSLIEYREVSIRSELKLHGGNRLSSMDSSSLAMALVVFTFFFAITIAFISFSL